jgi:hypothetical protein
MSNYIPGTMCFGFARPCITQSILIFLSPLLAVQASEEHPNWEMLYTHPCHTLGIEPL